ncbi:sel1 repeat family protein [Paractinoplanes lichenicola]|uniref:Sel1 repeat family protein n=1 Tax=Paractinoplanes lichenicola TaxID=2802976 RepID=A0ABS1W5B1_9ACTN|nr:sel1 repeat family protein [Actinoplanes lichenicola]MBL7261913.1 sel1 repeat family protein [Actinoplanes lichenicola]
MLLKGRIRDIRFGSGPDGASLGTTMNGRDIAADAQFTEELAWLYEAAGSPTHEALSRAAARWDPPVKLAKQTLSDWLTGKSVPNDPATVRRLITHLTVLARRRPTFVARPVDWRQLHASAKAARRGARRRSEDPEHQGPAPDAQDVSADGSGSPPLGHLVAECDPIALEVHRAIDIPGSDQQSILPAYVERSHDRRLQRIADEVLAGARRMITLVGESSTGKTRACWELVQYIGSHSREEWRIWHPFDPTRPEAAAEDIGRVGARTIVWLNEAQLYLAPPDSRLGERVAAGLRTLLAAKDAGPVLVLATMWPNHWTAITGRPETGLADPQAQARELLGGTDIDVPDSFTAADQADLAGRDDPQLNHARAYASGGRITQYLAGAPLLFDRYLKARPTARAVLDVAIDARRLGHPPAIPLALLEQAAPGYLDDDQWARDGRSGWLEQVLDYLAAPCNGARGPLTSLRPRPGEPHANGGPTYRLADYLEQVCTPSRLGVYPPSSFWDAAVSVIEDVPTLQAFGQAAERRGRYRDAALLYRAAAELGDVDALVAMARLREQAGDKSGATRIYEQAGRHDHAGALTALAFQRERGGKLPAASGLYQQAADHGDARAARALARLNGPSATSQGDPAAADGTLVFATSGSLSPAERTPTSDPRRARRAAAEPTFNRGDVGRLRQRSVDRAAVALADLTRRCEKEGDHEGAEAAAHRAADLGYTGILSRLALRREASDDVPGAIRLGRAAADRGNPVILSSLGRRRERAGHPSEALELYCEAANRGDLNALVHLTLLLESSGDPDGAHNVRHFGIDGGGAPQEPWDFDSPVLLPAIQDRTSRTVVSRSVTV